MKARRFFKKAFSVALCVALLGGTAVMLTAVSSDVAVSADAAEVYGDFEYEISDNEVTITEYTGNGGDVTIPDKIDGKPVTSIGGFAFYGCAGLTSITIPDSVTSIGSWAFSGCIGLTSITIPDSVTSIGWSTFENCTGLKSITIPDSVTSIETYAFCCCTGLTSITIPDSVTSIGDSAFEDCTGLTSIDVSENNSEYSSIDGVLFSKNKTELRAYPQGKKGSYSIPDSVTSIGWGAFEDCTGLTSITIPDSVTSIGDDAFYNTAWYNNKPYGLVYAGKVAYKFKGEMEDNTKIVLKSGTKGIADSAFSGCTGLTSITIPDSVTSISNRAFYGCTGLTRITIPDSVTSIGDSAFEDCTGLTSITIPDSVTSIGSWAFYDTAWYDNKPDGLVYAGKVAYKFKGEMEDNTKIVLKSGTKGITDYAFFGCTGLTSITIPDSVTSIGDEAFYGCTGLTSITIPDSVTSIGEYAFEYCTGLTSITIPDSVTSIGGGAFEDCTGLTSITIPDSVTSIGWGAFEDCDYLLTIYGKKGSAAEKYANDNGFIFVEIDFSLKNISSISSDSINLNETITLTAKAQYGTKPYTYAFMYKAPGAASWKVIGTKFGTSDTETFKPTKAGTYEILISVKDSTGKTEAKKFSLTVKDNKLANKSSVSGTDVPCGTKITITGAAEGGEGTYLYTYQIKKPGKTSWTTLGDKYGIDTSKVFTAKLSGAYEVRVLVKDGAGTVKSFTATVNSTGTLLTNKSTISTTTAAVGDKVTLAAVPDGGTAPYRFTYEYKKPGSTSWKTIGKRGATYKSVSFNIETTGTYEARVYIQDASDYVTVKTFKVTVS